MTYYAALLKLLTLKIQNYYILLIILIKNILYLINIYYIYEKKYSDNIDNRFIYINIYAK